jgi:hypothetical protein
MTDMDLQTDEELAQEFLRLLHAVVPALKTG